MFRIVADQKTIMDLAHRCGTLGNCEACILRPFCEAEGCFLHETSFIYEAHDESAIIVTPLNQKDPSKSSSSGVELLFGGQ